MMRWFLFLLAMPCIMLMPWSAAHAQSGEIRQGVFRGRPVAFSDRNGLAVVEGDIVLGRTDELTASPGSSAKGGSRSAAIYDGRDDVFVWPDGRMPYTIDPAIPNPERILQAIQHWNDNTVVRIEPRQDEPEELLFERSPTCMAKLGPSGIKGFRWTTQVWVSDGCSAIDLAHEIGHALGMPHENTRQDRDRYINAFSGNTLPEEGLAQDGFYEHEKRGVYDYRSLMHYPAHSYVRYPGEINMQSIPMGIPMGYTTLTASDADFVHRLLQGPPKTTVVDSNPPGLTLRVDGEGIQAPRTFEWEPGSRHTVEAVDPGPGEITRLRFGRWSDGGERAHEIVAGPEVTVFIANYVREHRVEVYADPPASGTVVLDPPSPDGFYPEQTSVTVKKIPAAGYYSVAQRMGQLLREPNRFYVTRPVRLATRFTRKPLITIETVPPGRTVKVNGQEVTAPESFEFTPGTRVSLSVAEQQPMDRPISRYWDPASACFRFQGWSDGGAASHEIVAGESARTYVARFDEMYRVAASSLRWSVTPTGMSTTTDTEARIELTPAPPDKLFPVGTEVTMRLILAPGTGFLQWTADADSPATVRVTDRVYVTAFTLPDDTAPFLMSYESPERATGFVYGITPGMPLDLIAWKMGPDERIDGVPDADGRLPFELAGVKVFVGQDPAPLRYVNSRRIGIVVPFAAYEHALRLSCKGCMRHATELRVEAGGNAYKMWVHLQPALRTHPRIFPGRTENEGGSLNTPANPAARGSEVAMLVTGLGQTIERGVDGRVTGVGAVHPEVPVEALVGGVPAEILGIENVAGLPEGVARVRIRVPWDTITGNDVALALYQGMDSDDKESAVRRTQMTFSIAVCRSQIESSYSQPSRKFRF